MKAFYPNSTDKILHKGTAGNTYRLDGFEKCITLASALRNNPTYTIKTVTITNPDMEQTAINLVNTVHDPKILTAYKSGKPAKLANASGILWQPKLYNYVLEEAYASKLAADEVLSTGKVLVIAGGGHHAEYAHPFGFCPINTMAITALYLASLGKRVSIVDLDTHYSNGCFDILKDNSDVKIYNLWNQTLEKWKYFEAQGNIWHRKVTNAQDYFSKLDGLLADINGNLPNVIIYHLGLDILETDRLSGVKGITLENIYERDRKVGDFIKARTLPFVIFLGGAYVDHSKGDNTWAQKQRSNLAKLECKLLECYNLATNITH